jgi:multidrug resistance efflux pump
MGCIARLKIALAEDDLEQARARTKEAERAVHAAEAQLARARENLRHVRAAEWLRLSDLHRAKRDHA